MFWKVAGFSQSNSLEVCSACTTHSAWPLTHDTVNRSPDRLFHVAQLLLDKDDCTLEELLDEEDIIQECKSLNGRLVAL